MHWYIKFSSYIRKFRRNWLQSHIWLMASSYMTKYLRISLKIRKPFLIFDFATDPIWISLYIRISFFLSVCRLIRRIFFFCELDPQAWYCIVRQLLICVIFELATNCLITAALPPGTSCKDGLLIRQRCTIGRRRNLAFEVNFVENLLIWKRLSISLPSSFTVDAPALSLYFIYSIHVVIQYKSFKHWWSENSYLQNMYISLQLKLQYKRVMLWLMMGAAELTTNWPKPSFWPSFCFLCS